ncbi:MAG: OmpA family protein [Rickettsiales bacterium]
MKMFTSSTVLAAGAAMLLAASAQAGGEHNLRGLYDKSTGWHTTKDVVRSSNGQPVVDSFGDCVLTKWDVKGGTGTCGSSLDVELRTVYFNFNSSKLTPAAKAKLNTLASTLKTKKVKTVKIVAFADEIGTTNYNQSLSQRRANSVASYLRGKGIKVTGKSEVRGLGETASKSQCEGIAGNELKACLWRDRRAEIEIVN